MDTVHAGSATREACEDRRLRVAFYCDASELGGAEVSLGSLIDALGPRIDAVVIGTNRRVVERLASRRPAETVLVPPIRRKRDVRAIAAHFRAIRSLGPDILHVSLNNPWASHWAILVGLIVPGVRVVAVEHCPQPASRLRQALLKRFTARRLAGHVAVGKRSATEVARLAGVPPSSIRTIYNGVPDLVLEPLPRQSDGPVIGSLGRLSPEKGFDVLVRALAQLPEVTAVLVGEGDERERLLQLARHLDVSQRLLLLGWSDEPRRYLTTFDLFVLPSRFEALPLAIVEAMLAELPVVATDVGSVAEAVADGETGLLVPPDDPEAFARAVDSLLRDRERMREMGKRGRARALERFAVDGMARQVESLYDEVVNRGSGRIRTRDRGSQPREPSVTR